MSNQLGRMDVYVRPFVDPTLPPGVNRAEGQLQISSEGGVYPRWRRDGKELFYVSPDGALMAVALEFDGVKVVPAAPHALFKARFASFGADMWRPVYAPADDGRRFLVNVLVEQTAPSPVTMVLNWPATLKDR